MVRLRAALPVALLLVAMISLTGVVLDRVYAGDLLTVLVVGAAAGSVAVSLLTRRLPSWLVAPLSVVALAGYAAAVLHLAARRAELPGDFGTILTDAARNGIPRLLTALIPAEPVPDTVVVPLVAAWLAGLAGAEVALRAGRVLLGLAPPALLFAGAVYVVGPNAEPAVWPTVLFAAAAAVALAVPLRRADDDDGGGTAAGTPVDGLNAAALARLRLRALAGTATGLAMVVGLTLVLAPMVTGRVDRTPIDPRRYVQPPEVESLDENPLIRISGWALNPDQELFRIRMAGDGTAEPGSGDGAIEPGSGDGTDPTGGPGTTGGGTGEDPEQPDDPAGRGTGVRVRLAVLNDYDGVTWRVGATYRNAGRVLPPPAVRPNAPVDRLRQEITVAELTGRLLPAVATPTEISGARVAYDPGSGTLMRPEGLVPGLAYTVTSVRDRPDLNMLTSANVPAGDAVARMLRVEPGVPEQLQRLAETLAAENGAPYSRALAAEEFLAEHYRMVADAPSGHAYPNLRFFLFGPPAGGGQRGTSEQFAAAFAVLGRLMGLPTRVVVGFQVPADGVVRGTDAYAWPEVLFEELGWVAFDPLPRPNSKPRPVEEDFTPKPEEPPPTPEETPPPTEEPGSPPDAAADAHPTGGGLSSWALASIAAAALPLGLALAAGLIALLRHRQRRRRLGSGTPADRVAGAWLEVTDALRLAGLPAQEHLAATEVAGLAREAGGTEHPGGGRPRGGGHRVGAGHPDGHRPGVAPDLPVDELAALVNTAVFAPGTTDERQATRAGELAVAYVDGLRRARPWWRRVAWSVHPGPLRWHR